MTIGAGVKATGNQPPKSVNEAVRALLPPPLRGFLPEGSTFGTTTFELPTVAFAYERGWRQVSSLYRRPSTSIPLSSSSFLDPQQRSEFWTDCPCPPTPSSSPAGLRGGGIPGPGRGVCDGDGEAGGRQGRHAAGRVVRQRAVHAPLRQGRRLQPRGGAGLLRVDASAGAAMRVVCSVLRQCSTVNSHRVLRTQREGLGRFSDLSLGGLTHPPVAPTRRAGEGLL